ncbi:hypothetical protein L209DRAFT_224758 [Thermothelomyces heterothallicus CBS 203.75]
MGVPPRDLASGRDGHPLDRADQQHPVPLLALCRRLRPPPPTFARAGAPGASWGDHGRRRPVVSSDRRPVVHGPCHHATVDVDQLGRKPFLLGACVQEVQRLYNKPLRLPVRAGGHAAARRRRTRVPAEKGAYRSVVPRGGANLNEDVWGPDAGAFRPERLIDTPPGEEKRRRGSLIPFGWGEYLCPGRRFAVTEITGLVGAVALLFDVDDVKGVTVPPIRAGFAGCAMADPDWKSSDPPRAVFRRRKGWENAQLRFTV